MKIFRIVVNFLSWVFVLVICAMVLYMITSNYDILLGYRSFLVQSGSMEPAIMTGDIIITHEKKNYMLNDTVTFKNAENRIVTHRISAVTQEGGETKLYTKGDANRSEDFDTISFRQIIGKVVFVMPKFGHLVAFSKSMLGLIILVLAPAGLFIVDELLKMRKHA